MDNFIIKASRYGDLSLDGEWEDANGEPITPAPIGIEVIDNDLCPNIDVELVNANLSTFRVFASADDMGADVPRVSWFRLRLLLANGTSKISTFRYELHVE